MKKILLICLGFLCFFGRSETEEPENKHEVTVIRYGTSFGFCQNNISITSSEVTLNKNGWVYDPIVLSVITDKKQIENSYIQELFEKVNFDDFLELKETIGCPDCADGGAEWLEISTKNNTHKVTFEYLNNKIPELEDILTTIREFYNSLQKEVYVVIDNDTYNNTSTAYYTITAAVIEGDILTISILSSGCDGNRFITNLIDSGSLLESSPLQRKLKINLINQEACLAIVTKDYEIDISKLQVEGENELHLDIEGWSEKIIYSY